MLQRHPPPSSGFSLIELVIALGIATFSLMAIVAVMPVGLISLRSAMDQFLEARIIQKISGDLAMTPFERIEGNTLFFDSNGMETDDPADARYRAVSSLRNHGSETFPGADAAAVSQNLAIIEVKIFRVVPNGTDISTVTFPLAIARGR